MLRHWSRSAWWCERKLMLQMWNRKTKTATVTRNLVLELKYMIVNKIYLKKKTDTTCPAPGRPLKSSPARPSKLPAPGSPYCHTLDIYFANQQSEDVVSSLYYSHPQLNSSKWASGPKLHNNWTNHFWVIWLLHVYNLQVKLSLGSQRPRQQHIHSIHCLFPKLPRKAPKALSHDTNSPSLWHIGYNSTILKLYYNKSCIWLFYTTTNNQICQC